eukprot:NODE_3105_length_597_cov_79.742701_g2600_i0.p2 GENE.NODE_3105_length_597_cov_79.742701_g2600_i0~~NODE_3105_length_597_cov_79.742701_g2600_i0.p2  ORF type:complete len:53 (+),score=7.71 NODE_3105_length_597_cov_79.742701_g2600_i0:156-314(+)
MGLRWVYQTQDKVANGNRAHKSQNLTAHNYRGWDRNSQAHIIKVTCIFKHEC